MNNSKKYLNQNRKFVVILSYAITVPFAAIFIALTVYVSTAFGIFDPKTIFLAIISLFFISLIPLIRIIDKDQKKKLAEL